jgi:hypothetical protein
MITIVTKIECQDSWDSKVNGVIFVEKESDVEILFNELVSQDDYWENYKKLIQVMPKEINTENELKSYCNYVGKTDIWDISKLRKVVDFTIYQYGGYTTYFN